MCEGQPDARLVHRLWQSQWCLGDRSVLSSVAVKFTPSSWASDVLIFARCLYILLVFQGFHFHGHPFVDHKLYGSFYRQSMIGEETSSYFCTGFISETCSFHNDGLWDCHLTGRWWKTKNDPVVIQVPAHGFLSSRLHTLSLLGKSLGFTEAHAFPGSWTNLETRSRDSKMPLGTAF